MTPLLQLVAPSMPAPEFNLYAIVISSLREKSFFVCGSIQDLSLHSRSGQIQNQAI